MTDINSMNEDVRLRELDAERNHHHGTDERRRTLYTGATPKDQFIIDQGRAKQTDACRNMDDPGGWRRLDPPDRSSFLAWVYDSEANRQEFGRREHGDTFIGDPLAHAIEELLDALFYLWAAQRRLIHQNGVTGLNRNDPRPWSAARQETDVASEEWQDTTEERENA